MATNRLATGAILWATGQTDSPNLNYPATWSQKRGGPECRDRELERSVMHEDELDYARRRARQEAALALSLRDPRIAAVHRKMAAAYRARVALLSTTPASFVVPWSVSA